MAPRRARYVRRAANRRSTDQQNLSRRTRRIGTVEEQPRYADARGLTIIGTGHTLVGVEPRSLPVDRARVMSPYPSCSIGGEMVGGAEASESDERSSRAAIRQME